MLNTVAQFPSIDVGEGVLETIQNLSDGRIPNAVHIHLEAGLQSRFNFVLHLLLAIKKQTFITWIIRVTHKQGRTTTSQCAVGIELYAAHGETVIAIPNQWATLGERLEILHTT